MRKRPNIIIENMNICLQTKFKHLNKLANFVAMFASLVPRLQIWRAGSWHDAGSARLWCLAEIAEKSVKIWQKWKNKNFVDDQT